MIIAIVPAYNEKKRIGSVVRSLFEHVDKVVVVDDASKDSTAAIARDAGAVVLSHGINRGQGAALETGHAYARKVEADFVLHFDGDGQFDVGDIVPGLEKLKNSKADILFGSRFLDSRSQIPFLKKYILLPIGKIINRILAGIYLTDAHNGFRILNKKALQNLKITQDGMAHATEILVLAKKYNLQYIEYPVKVTYHEYGQRAVGGLKILRDLFMSRFVK